MPVQNHKSCYFGVRQGFVLDPVQFSLFINDLPASLRSFVSCSLYADVLVIWFSSPSVPAAAAAAERPLKSSDSTGAVA